MARGQDKRDQEIGHSLARALAATDPGEPVDLARFDGVDLLQTLVHHGTVALLDQRIEDGVVTGLDPTTCRQLRELTQREAALDLAMNHSLGLLAGHLQDNGFDTLVLKGSALAHRHYPESRLRPRCDTDLWIRPADAGALAETLAQLDYQVLHNDLRQRSRKQFHVSRETFDGEPLWFDVHYRLSNRALFRNLLPFEEAFDRAQQIDLGDLFSTAGNNEADVMNSTAAKPSIARRMTIPDNPTLLLHAAIHRIAHGRNSDNDRLIWLYDMHLLWRAMDSAERLRLTDLALDTSQGCLVADALARCAALFGTEISEKRFRALQQRRGKEPSAALLNRGKWAWAWSDLRGEPGLGGKAAFAMELLRNRRRETH